MRAVESISQLGVLVSKPAHKSAITM